MVRFSTSAIKAKNAPNFVFFHKKLVIFLKKSDFREKSHFPNNPLHKCTIENNTRFESKFPWLSPLIHLGVILYEKSIARTPATWKPQKMVKIRFFREMNKKGDRLSHFGNFFVKNKRVPPYDFDKIRKYSNFTL